MSVSNGDTDSTTNVTEDAFAGFWRRAGASLIDGFILLIVGLVVGMVVGVAYFFVAGTAEGSEMVGRIVGALLGWIYFAGFESSDYQATIGKSALDIKVTDLKGRPIGFGTATGRHFGKIISSLILLIGYFMAGFTEKKQALHDKMAGCLVVMDRE